MSALIVQRAGPGLTVQDAGWPSTMALGLSQGGVADTSAYARAGALLGHAPGAVIEMAGTGGLFHVKQPLRVSLTGAPMRASLDGAPLIWDAVHGLTPGQILEIGPCLSGIYGYLGFGGGINAPLVMGSSSTHRPSGIGRIIQPQDEIATHPDPHPDRIGLRLPQNLSPAAPIRIVPTAQTGMFPPEVLARFTKTCFTRAPRGNRQGVGLESEHSFTLEGGQSLVSEMVIPGDIQLPGDGTPVVLLADCQTTGGYPRLAAVLPCDLPRVVQAEPGAELRFELITRATGLAAMRAEAEAQARLASALEPIIRDPSDIRDLLSYQLISGAITGREHPRDKK